MARKGCQNRGSEGTTTTYGAGRSVTRKVAKGIEAYSFVGGINDKTD